MGAALAASVFLASCGVRDEPDANTRILMMGDSILAWFAGQDGSVGDEIERQTGLPVANRAAPGARLSHTLPGAAADGYDIRAQYVPGAWDWVVLNGGANDLLSECGCTSCDATLTTLIDARAQAGQFPDLIRKIRRDGARVILLGYYNASVVPNPFSLCGEVVDRLNARLERLAVQNAGVSYVTAERVIDPRNPAHYFLDQVHPSRLGARRIGDVVAQVILRAP